MLNLILVIAFLLGGSNQKAIENYLRANLIDYVNFEYRVINPQKFEKANFRIDYSREFTLKNHYGYIPVIVKNGKYEERTFIPVNLKLYKKALVAARKIRRGEIVGKEDFQIRICDVTKLREKPVSGYAELENSRAKMNIREGAILTKGMIEKNDDVFAGEKITALYSNKTVAISFPVVARSGGKKGETIRVQRKDGIVFKAKVMNKKLVTILE